jgi:ParB family chromosome partitioning protein
MLTWHPIKIKLADLKPFDRNPRTITDSKFESLKKSLDDLGEFKPLVVDYDQRTILSGNQRYRAMLEKYNLSHEVDCYIPNRELSEAEREKVVVVDNAHHGTWDYDVLANFSIDIGELDLDISIPDIELPEVEQIEGQCDDDEIPEVKHSVTRRGDLWTIGKHRLLCGDSTMIDDVERLMGEDKADITFTSPPYNVSKKGFQGAKYESGFENRTDEEYNIFLKDFTSLALEKSSYVFVNNQFLANNRFSLIEYQYNFKEFLKDILIWNKKIAPPNICKGAFNTKWEYVFCFSKDNRTRGFPCKWQGKYFNVIETESNSGNEHASIHKAGFPLSFPLWILEKMDFCKSVYEPFCGTGTTLIACEKLGMNCFSMELSEHYVDVIIERYLKFTGRDDVYLESTGEKYLNLKESRNT